VTPFMMIRFETHGWKHNVWGQRHGSHGYCLHDIYHQLPGCLVVFRSCNRHGRNQRLLRFGGAKRRDVRPALAFAVIHLPGLRGTFSEGWYDVAGNPVNTIWNYRRGSLSATPEPLSAGFAFAGLLFLAAYRRWRLKAV